MAKNRLKKKKKKKNVNPNKADRDLIRDAGGYDWGWPSVRMVSANPELIRRLRDAGFHGCGYGLLSENGPPFLALVGDNLAGMKSVLALMREWVDVVGPNAVKVEILLDGPGYVLTVSQQHSLLRWRLDGLNTSDHPLVVTMSITKRLDTRHPFLERLADYSRRPIAPLLLTVAGPPPNAKSRFGALDTTGFQPEMEGSIMLPGIDVYAKPEDRPRDSMVKLESEIPSPSERRWPPEQSVDAASVSRERERRLMATFPKTMHVLRHRNSTFSVLDQLRSRGCANWQVEQAICNLRLREHIPSNQTGNKRLVILEQIRMEMIEHASMPFDASAFSLDDILHQISLDTAYVLRRVDSQQSLPNDLDARNARLRELGYV
ncbi:hypothetical protein [Lysobacter sp. H23M47]|uniref:hypothetical protein n=1 Tax=Lysobacter sp. H23M47 TaxID=2781024 RepID=UPI00187E0F78|nr:hypothetical protein [Lysobacter sp. H23M47]QOW24822.1 hypothetical protein INQ43_01720 [Lysobacter sp. H23M47]